MRRIIASWVLDRARIAGSWQIVRRTLLVIALASWSGLAAAQGPMTNGANHAGAISAPGETDLWTFSAAAGSSVILSIGEVGADSPFYPWIKLYSPTAALVAQSYGALGAEITAVASASGTYTVVVDSADTAHTATGSYVLTSAVIPGSFTVSGGDEGGPMTNGENHTGLIQRADIDPWTFSAAGGDAIILSAGEVGADSPFYPWIRLYGPTGALIGSSYGVLGAEITAAAPATGSYTVVVDSADTSHSATGSYTLTLAKMAGAFVVPAGDEGGAMTNGANHTGVIQRADLDMWSFAANGGDSVIVSAGEVGADSPFYPWIRLYGPTGALIGSSYGVLGAEITAAAPSTGTYTVVVDSADTGHSATGSYTLTLAKMAGAFVVPAGDEGGAMTSGANNVGVIQRADLDMWSFTAGGGDSLVVSIGELGADSPFYPWIRLYGPTGALIGSSYGVLGGEISATAPASGTYTVVVDSADTGHSATGNYRVILARMPATFVVPAGDEGGPMENNILYTGTIQSADIDLWSFRAAAGHAVTVTISEVGADSPFYPWIRLYRPNGALLASSYGAVTAQVNVTIPESGYYTVLVDSADTPHAASGTYSLKAIGIEVYDIPPPPTNVYGDVAIDFGTTYGLWLRANHAAASPQWLQLHSLTPTRMARGDIDGDGMAELIVGFQGYGVWIWRYASGWSQLHSFDATDIATGDLDGNGKADIFLNFPGAGLWVRYDNGTWKALHGLNTTVIATGQVDNDAAHKADLVVNFPGYGVWAYLNDASWIQVHGLTATDIRLGDLDGNGQDEIVLNFPGQGLWIKANNATWTQLHWLNTAGMTIGNLDGDAQGRKDLVINLPGYGVYARMNNSTWSQLHGLNAPVLTTVDLDNDGRDDVVMNFTGYGVWLWKNNAAYEQLHPSDVEGLAAGRFDDK
jgi:hypothetical protein